MRIFLLKYSQMLSWIDAYQKSFEKNILSTNEFN